MLPNRTRVINRKIGQLLLERRLVTQEIIDEALGMQKSYGISLGTYLVRYGYVKEEDIVQCLSEQYGFPVIDLANFKVDIEILNLIPVSVATKYSLIPIDRLYGLVTVAMADPLNDDAIQAVKTITGCEVQVFIATLSDINTALQSYYGIIVYEGSDPDEKTVIVTTSAYSGAERRKYFRFKAQVDIHFALQEHYKKGQTKDISGGGVCFVSDNNIPVDSYLTLEINLPSNIIKRPVASVVKVMRVRELESGAKHEIGAQFVQLDPLERALIIKYAKTFQ